MEREKLDEILTILNSIPKSNDMQEGAQLLDKLCDKIGYPRIPVQDLMEKDDQDAFQQELKKCILLIEKKIRVEDVDYFYDNLDISWIVFVSDEKKIDRLEEIADEAEKSYVIESIEDEEKKIEQLEKLTKQWYKVKILETIQDDDKKIKYLEKVEDEPYKLAIIKTIQDDDKKIEQLEKLTEERKKAYVIESIQDDDKKLELLENLTTEQCKTTVIATMQNDDKKIEQLEKLTEERNKAYVIASIQDDDKKLELLENLTTEQCKTTVIATMQNDDKKIEQLEKLTEERNKAYVIATIQDDDKKIGQLENLIEEENKEKVIKTIQDDDKKLEQLEKITNKDIILADINILSYIKRHKNNSKINRMLLKHVDLNEETLEIIGDEYSLSEEQKQKIKSLYEKNDELLKTINYKILDEKYADLEDKLSIITTYKDIQQEILGLDDIQYKVFIETLQEHETRNGEWINFTSKIVSNLCNGQYEELIKNIQDKELTEEDIRNIGNIISKENIFNIKNLEDIKNYENIKKRVCESIIKGSNSEDLEKYPYIMQLSDIERKKLAVLQKVYGETLKEAEYLLDLYGADIENLEITSESESYIEYIKSLKIIEETDDIEVLKKIYEKSQTIKLDNVYDIEMIEEELKNAYLKTYNEKLYQPKEKDLAQTVEVDGQEIPIYDAGTEFSMSVSSINAYVRERTSYSSYKEDWNRPKTESQGFCTSYIRNDMLATATISNVLFGFTNYDKGTLIRSGREDLYSNAATFKVVANFEQFLTEDVQINYTTWHNEMVFNRNNANGERKQPDYIVYIKEGQEPERRNFGK